MEHQRPSAGCQSRALPPVARSARRSVGDRRDGVDQGQHLGRIVGVGRREADAQRDTGAVHHWVVLRAGFAPVDRVRLPPRSVGSICQGTPVLRAKTMPAGPARSGLRGQPPVGSGGSFDRNGPTASRRSSETDSACSRNRRCRTRKVVQRALTLLPPTKVHNPMPMTESDGSRWMEPRPARLLPRTTDLAVRASQLDRKRPRSLVGQLPGRNGPSRRSPPTGLGRHGIALLQRGVTVCGAVREPVLRSA